MNDRKVFLYAFDRTARVVNYRFLEGPDICIGKIRAMAKQMYLLAGKEQIVVYAIDNFPNLKQYYWEAIRTSDPAEQYAFYDLLDRDGLYIHN